MGLQDKLDANKSKIETGAQTTQTETSNNNPSANAAIQAERIEAAKNGKVQTSTGTVDLGKGSSEGTKANEETKKDVIEDIKDSTGDLNAQLTAEDLASAGLDPLSLQQEEGTIGDALSRLAGLEILPPYDPPKSAYKSNRIHQLILPDGRVEKPNEYGYYVDPSKEALVLLEHFLKQGKVEQV